MLPALKSAQPHNYSADTADGSTIMKERNGMKLLSTLALLLAVSCIQRASTAKTLEGENALAALYEGTTLHNLQNWSSPEAITAEEIKTTKKAIMAALRKIGFNTLPELSADDILVSFAEDSGVISILSADRLCQGEDLSACFYLQIVPHARSTYQVVIIKLPAYESLSELASSWIDEDIEELLSTLQEVFPHSLTHTQLEVSSHGESSKATLVLLTKEDPQRELHIEAQHGVIDNSRNAQHGYQVYQNEMRALDQASP